MELRKLYDFRRLRRGIDRTGRRLDKEQDPRHECSPQNCEDAKTLEGIFHATWSLVFDLMLLILLWLFLLPVSSMGPREVL